MFGSRIGSVLVCVSPPLTGGAPGTGVAVGTCCDPGGAVGLCCIGAGGAVGFAGVLLPGIVGWPGGAVGELGAGVGRGVDCGVCARAIDVPAINTLARTKVLISVRDKRVNIRRKAP